MRLCTPMIKFRGKSKNTDHQNIVEGFGCYADRNERQFIITDDPIPMTYIQVDEIQIVDMTKELQSCIECGEPVDENEPVKNCHGNCRLEL